MDTEKQKKSRKRQRKCQYPLLLIFITDEKVAAKTYAGEMHEAGSQFAHCNL